MTGYVLGREAGQDLEALWDYVAKDSLQAADRLIAGLFEAFQALARTPGIGHTREGLTQFPVLFWAATTLSSIAPRNL
jgi:plasmid stabilization system protein ParE